MSSIHHVFEGRNAFFLDLSLGSQQQAASVSMSRRLLRLFWMNQAWRRMVLSLV